ncbi:MULTISPECIES: alanine racemase [Thermocrispum]|jgi:D-serine deaminase-like pyridoxal phosphate-dependent protein|uniref:Alanine racemase n=1 Tax=Thermocrispum agreste TaxID=37925 RepID=A0A2W4JQE2_9PSEU|nr:MULTISPECIES: alanine racemase [Thermocrispum]PZN00559.1 MAG: alanine racemase [Thermocrispum agreste]
MVSPPTSAAQVSDRSALRRAYDAATAAVEAPLAIVDLRAFDDNLATLAARAHGRPIRVASKSVRCRFLLDRALSHPATEGVMAYSLAEALWLHRNAVSDDILVGYPTVDAAALRALAASPEACSAITLMVDSTDHLDLIENVLGRNHPPLRVCIELDVSWRPLPGVHIGTRRSPVFTAVQAAALARAVVARDGFQLVGLMGYEGQIAGVGDKAGNPMKSALMRSIQRRSAAELTERRGAAVRAVRAVADLEFVNGGGTGSLETTTADPSVTEVTAGSGLIGPTLFDQYSRFRPQPAVVFALPVVRKPAPDVATLFAGGYIASGPPGPDRQPAPYLPDGLKLTALEGAGEVQTPVVGSAARQLAVGDRVWMRHAKAGELAERFDAYHVVVGDKVEEVVPTYRGEGVNFG